MDIDSQSALARPIRSSFASSTSGLASSSVFILLPSLVMIGSLALGRARLQAQARPDPAVALPWPRSVPAKLPSSPDRGAELSHLQPLAPMRTHPPIVGQEELSPRDPQVGDPQVGADGAAVV